MNNYYIEYGNGGKGHCKFETDYAIIKHYKKWYYGSYKIYKEVSTGKFELIYERKRKRDNK